MYVGIREIFSLHRHPASIKHTHQRITSPPAPIRTTNDECLPDATVNLPNTIYPGLQPIVVGSPYDPSWRSTHTTVAFLNGSDTTCEFTTFHISNHHTKSLSSGRTRASISGPLSAAYSRSTTCRGKLKYPPTTFLTSAVSVLESTRMTPRLALTINGPSSTSLPFQDRVDDHAAKLFFRSAPSRNRSRNRSLTRTTWSRIATRTTQCLILVLIKRRLAKPNTQY